MQRPREWTTVGILAASLALNVYLGLRVGWGGGSPEVDASRKFALAAGDKVPPIEAVAPDGTPMRWEFEAQAKPSVVYVISPSCVWCVRNEANFAALVKERSSEFRFVVISLKEEGLPEYLTRVRQGWSSADVTVLMNPTLETRRRMFLGGTPQTFVVARDSTVQAVWPGAFTPDNTQVFASLESFFNVKFPGLQTEVAVSESLCQHPVDGGTYSAGAVIDLQGKRVECGPRGKWVAATR